MHLDRMEYDEQVSARLHMSLDEIIGQDQQGGSTQIKKRRARGGFPGLSSPPPPATNASPSRPPPMLPPESASRFAAPFPPAVGGPTCFGARPPHSARPPPALVHGPLGRLPGPPPFGVGPRPPFHLPPGHPRMDPRWPRPRHVGGGYLMTPNGVQPPPPPMAAGPGIGGARKSITHVDIFSVGSSSLVARMSVRPTHCGCIGGSA